MEWNEILDLISLGMICLVIAALAYENKRLKAELAKQNAAEKARFDASWKAQQEAKPYDWNAWRKSFRRDLFNLMVEDLASRPRLTFKEKSDES